MASQALYRKWRPLTFEEIVSQGHVTFTLRNALVTDRIAHAYLFTGPRGTGKTTMARVLAKAVNCLADDPAVRPCNQCQHCVAVNEGRFLDLIEIDAASHTSVDDVRELRDRIAFAPNEGRYKVYIVDEVHRFSGAAFDALLKTIEEPPAHAIFVLATTEVHKVPQTILSRCQRFDFRRIPVAAIVDHLASLAGAEGWQVEGPALELIARQATGSLRDAISLFDQLIAQPGDVLTLDLAEAILGTAASQAVQAVAAAIIAGDSAGGLAHIAAALDAGADPRQFARQMVEYLRLVMLVQTGGAALAEVVASPDALTVAQAHAEGFPRRPLLQAITAFGEAAADRGAGWQPQLPLELALLRSIDTLHAAPQEETLARPAPASASVQPPSSRPPVVAAAPVRPPAVQPLPLAQEPPPATEVSNSLPLAELQARWEDVQALVKQTDTTRAVSALLASGRLYAVEGDTVIYQMPSAILRDKIDAGDNRALIEGALQQVFGLPLRFTCKVQSQAADAVQDDDLLSKDPTAAFVVKELGGKVKKTRK